MKKKDELKSFYDQIEKKEVQAKPKINNLSRYIAQVNEKKAKEEIRK